MIVCAAIVVCACVVLIHLEIVYTVSIAYEYVINRAVDFFEQSPVEQARLRQLWQVRTSNIYVYMYTILKAV
jgi:hypothetical protein